MNKTELVEYFGTIGFHPNHRLGQNFLVDRNLAQKLVKLASLQPGQRVVEVGPGMGMITREILASGANVTAVEMDARLLAYLTKEFADLDADRLRLVEGDAVELPLAGEVSANEVSVVANPPFAITGPWLASIMDQGFPKTLALLLQKEAVERITAKFGSKHFGVLAIRLGAAYDVKSLHPVPPQSFFPPPRIDSQIVVFERKPEPVAFSAAFLEMVKSLFGQRRKQMGGKLKRLLSSEVLKGWEHVLAQAGFSLQSRPEQIPTHVWVQLNQVTQTSL